MFLWLSSGPEWYKQTRCHSVEYQSARWYVSGLSNTIGWQGCQKEMGSIPRHFCCRCEHSLLFELRNRIYSYFQLFWLRAICFNDELIPGVSLQLCKPEQRCLLHMSGSGPSCNRRLITAGEARSKNGTQLPPAALNYFSNTRFLFPLFSASSLVSVAFLFVSDLSVFHVFFPSAFSSIFITWPPHLSSFIFGSQFPAHSPSTTSSAFAQDLAEAIWLGIVALFYHI